METPNRRNYVILPLVFSLLLVAGIYIGLKIKTEGPGGGFLKYTSAQARQENKINDILDYIEEQYVDTINKKWLVENTLRDMLQNLDPHSAFISADELKATNEPLQGNFEGIGIEFNIINDTIRVISAISGGPSEAVGIMAGDKIVKIEGKNVAGIKITNKDVMDKLRGVGGTQVTVSIERYGMKKLLDFTITRGTIPIYSVDIAYMPAPGIGYIKISRFAATTYDEYMQAFGTLRDGGMKKLILDLRGNPGGLLKAAVDIADEFLQAGKQIVYTEGKAHPKKTHKATATGEFEKNELIILIDEGSASASEIVAGAIQDNDRGSIVGRRSFGKGLVQEQSEFSDGSAIRLTIARYYTPTGRCIQKPYDKGTEEYYREELERYENGELEVQDSVKYNDSLKYTTPGGKIVYGGGGIIPDIFIPMDTAGRSAYLFEVSNKGLINRFAFSVADKNRLVLKEKYTSGETFSQHYIVDQKLLDEFTGYAEKSGVKKNEEQFRVSKNIISHQLKALIARNVFGNSGFYPVIHQQDKAVQQAIKLLSEKN